MILANHSPLRLVHRLWIIAPFLLVLLFSSGVAHALSPDDTHSINTAQIVQNEKDIIVVGSEQDYPPFSTGMTDETAGGFTVELWKKVAAEAGLKYTIRVRPLNELLQELKAGKIDVILNLPITKEHHEFADFSIPHAIIHGGIFVRKNQSNIKTEADLDGKSIIVRNGDLAHDYAVSMGWGKHLVIVDTVREGMRLLASGKHDAMLTNKLTGVKEIQETGINNIMVLKVNADFKEKFAFAVQEGQSELFSKINEALAYTKASGTYDDLYDKWFGVYQEKEIGLRDILKYLLPILIIFFLITIHSIYKRKKESRLAFKAIQESEQKLSTVMNNTDAFIYIKDIEGKYLFANRKVCNLFAMPLQDILGHDDGKFFDAETAKALQANDRRILEKGETLKTEETNHNLFDGTTSTYLTVKLPLLNEQGEIYALCGISTDITDQKSAQNKILESLSLLNATLESTNDAILVVDLNNKWVSYNQKFLQLWKISDDILLANDDNAALTYVLNQLEDADSFLSKVKKLYGSPDTSSFDTIQFKDGKIVERYSIPQVIDTKIVGRVWSFHDVTEVKQAEAKLIKSEARSRAIIEISPVPLAINDKDGKITFLNKAFSQVLGYTLYEIPTLQDWWQLANPDPKYRKWVSETWQKNLDEAKRSNKPFVPLEVKMHCKDASIRTFMCSSTSLPEQHNESNLVIMYDITDRILAEEKIKEMRTELEVSRDRYADLYEFAPIGYLSLSTHGLITEVNWKVTALFGLPRKDLHQHRLAEFVTEDDKGLWQRTFSSLKNLSGGEELGVDIKFINTKGTEFIASLNCLRMDDDDDQPILRITLIDVTQLKDAEEKLQQSEAYLRTIIDNEPECIKVIDARGNLKQMNPAGLAMLEVETLEQATSIPLLDYIAPEYRSAFADLHKRVIAGESMQLEYEIIGNKGCRRWVDTHAVPFQYQSKKMILAVTRDFTERKIAENELRISATAFESQEGIVIADANHNIVRVNHAFNNITGYSSDEVIGKNPRLLSSGLQTPEFYAALWNRVDQTGSWQGEIWNKRKNGELYLEYLTITSVKNEAGILTNYVATLSDVTQNKLAAAEIEKLAFYDALTGLPNRRLMVDRLSQALASSARTGNRGAVVFLDLDHFKSLNDTLGHHVGDKLLQQVGSRLKSCVREGDTVARLGGDEYVVLLEKLSEKEIEAARQVEIIANNILTTLNHPHHLEEHEYLSTASIGISIFYDHNQPVEELLKQADIAMYQAKKAGRNTLRYFDPKMQDVIQERVSLEGDLRKALEKRQLTLYYQVQVDFLHHPIGVEALIRWKHPERGLVPPFEFIPIAEETGLIIPIGQWVLETACAQIKAWDKHEQTRKLTISINVSSKQFRQPDFAIQVHKTLERYAINPALLKLELTESLLLDNIEDTINTMNVLKNNGVLFSLDDFGTGYSSLQYLKRLPLYQLKIDQSFVRDIAVDSNDLAIIRTIIAMAHILDLSVIAEGVETEKQQQLLLSIGCTNYQGYLFGKPMAIAPFEKALNKI